MTYQGTSIVDYLKSTGGDSSFSSRSNLASKYGISNYTGTASQNTQLLNSLKSGVTTPTSSGPTIQGNALVPQVGPSTTIKPTVITSDSATKDLNKIKSTVTQADADMKAQAQKVAQEKATADAKASADAATKLAADQKAEELRIKEAALAEPGAEAKATKTAAELQLEKTLSDYESESENVANTIRRIQSGAIPLNAGEQAQVDGLRNSYQQLIDEQRLVNKGAVGTQNIRGYQTGAAEYDPTFQTKVIGGIVTAGLQKIANLETQMSAAVATLIQGFKTDNITAIKDAWDVYNQAAEARTNALNNTIADANAAIKDANDRLEKQRVEQIAVRADIDSVAGAAAKNFAPPEIIAAINAAKTVGEAIAAAGKYIGDQNAQLERALINAQIAEKYANIEAMRAETIANSPQAKALEAQSEVLSNISLIDSVLASPYINQVFGLKNPLTYWTPGSNEQAVKNQVNQIINVLSLENRQKLKGSGAISDFEARMLQKASSSLAKNLDDESAKKELRRIRGAFSTAAGLTATVKITAPNGESRVVEADRAGIDQALIDGLTVEYQ